LALTGPRNYLLIEQGRRRTPGTRIEALLRTQPGDGEITRAIQRWYRKVEFPIIVNDLGVERTVVAEGPRDFEYEIPDVTDPEASLAVRHFEINRPGVEGELYVFVRRDSEGESWDAWNWASYAYPTAHPQAARPPFPENLTCANGLTQPQTVGLHGPTATRLDFRDGSQVPVLGRNARRAKHRIRRTDPRIISRWEEILLDHLEHSERARGIHGWKYIQRLVGDFDVGSFWDTIPRAVRVLVRGDEQVVSLAELLSVPRIATLVRPDRNRPAILRRKFRSPSADARPSAEALSQIQQPLIEDPAALSTRHREKIFQSRSIESSHWLQGGLVLVWSHGAENWEPRGEAFIKPLQWARLPDASAVAVETQKTLDSTYTTVIFNTESSLIQWLLRAKDACYRKVHSLRPDQYENIRDMLFTAAAYGAHNLQQVTQYLDGWRQIPGLPTELYPPKNPSAEQFLLTSPDER
jgi:hypothetical protein